MTAWPTHHRIGRSTGTVTSNPATDGDRTFGGEGQKSVPRFFDNLIGGVSGPKISLSSSHMVGDMDIDIEAGEAAGCKTVLIDNSRTDSSCNATGADHVCGSLTEATTWILDRTE
jgi:phosphoglycolate phosphatase-like HAD superfamily hydrolase